MLAVPSCHFSYVYIAVDRLRKLCNGMNAWKWRWKERVCYNAFRKYATNCGSAMWTPVYILTKWPCINSSWIRHPNISVLFLSSQSICNGILLFQSKGGIRSCKCDSLPDSKSWISVKSSLWSLYILLLVRNLMKGEVPILHDVNFSRITIFLFANIQLAL